MRKKHFGCQSLLFVPGNYVWLHVQQTDNKLDLFMTGFMTAVWLHIEKNLKTKTAYNCFRCSRKGA